jgi:hypothetical protein
MEIARRILCIVAVLALGGAPRVSAPFEDDDGNASAGLAVAPPNHAVQAALVARSYAPGSTATVALRGRATGLQIRIFRAGAGHSGPLQGTPVTPLVGRTFTVGRWPSGLYYADVKTPARGDWYAPFVVRASRLGVHRVAVVLPTNTWQAYNFEGADSWYADPNVHEIDLSRPYVDGGVPPHYTGYDSGFMRWLVVNHHATDFLTDDDLDRIGSGASLARAYDLVVFSGHEEYVTEHEFDVVQRYRDLGGNLAFLSANNFFYKVVKHGDRMNGRWRWRDLGRPEASLVGSQYVDWNHARYANEPYVAADVEHASWLFKGTGLHDGTSFGKYGIEVDAKNAASPPDTRVLAQIHGIFGPDVSAQMTYYSTAAGAKVFAAGVMNFGGSALWPVVATMMQNIWTSLATS